MPNRRETSRSWEDDAANTNPEHRPIGPRPHHQDFGYNPPDTQQTNSSDALTFPKPSPERMELLSKRYKLTTLHSQENKNL